jgi:hypothetical protein
LTFKFQLINFSLERTNMNNTITIPEEFRILLQRIKRLLLGFDKPNDILFDYKLVLFNASIVGKSKEWENSYILLLYEISELLEEIKKSSIDSLIRFTEYEGFEAASLGFMDLNGIEVEIFEQTELSQKEKKLFVKKLENEITYYENQLNGFKHQNNSTTSSIIELPKDFQHKDIPKDGLPTNLDKYQAALLFHYLREKGVIIKYDDTSLSKLVFYLTGHSAQNIRTALGSIYNVQKDTVKNKTKNEKLHNLSEVKRVLNSILLSIKKSSTPKK